MNKLIRKTLVFAALMTSFTLAYAEETHGLSDFDDARKRRWSKWSRKRLSGRIRFRMIF